MQNISTSYFDKKRQQEVSKFFGKSAIAQFAMGGMLCFLSLPLGIWIGTAGIMLGGFAGGVRLLPTFNKGTSRYSKNTGLRLKTSRSTRVRNHARAYRRSASRSAFAGGKNSSGGDSESGPGDPPGTELSFLVTLFQKFYQKLNSANLRGIWTKPPAVVVCVAVTGPINGVLS